MSTEVVGVSEMPDSNAEEPLKSERLVFQMNHGSNGNLSKENEFTGSSLLSEDTHEQLLQIVMELKFQNEFFKSQFEDFKDSQLERGGSQQQVKVAHENDESADVRELHERIECLKKELHEEKLTRGAAEEALRHLREEYAEADANARDLSAKLVEAKQKLDQEIKEREEKYVELDSKFQRLHKRAKQRIQEIQKEKDDLEAKFLDVRETADRASSQQSALQQELERTRQQANEALKAMDADRQQLRSANNNLRVNVEELRRSLHPKEQALESLQQTILEKEQMLEDMRGLLQSADEKRLASLSELSAKYQKNIDNLEAQLTDALADRSKATETISSLQDLVAEKESKIAEVEAGSSGEAARLRAAVEAVKGELAHVKHEQGKEKDSWEAALQALKSKLEIAESNCIHAEIEAAKIRSQLDMEMSVKAQILNTRDVELLAAKEEIKRLESEFSSYKVRAHALLQKKEAELASAKDSEQVKALEDALREAEKELELTSAEKDKILQDLQEALSNYEEKLAERDAALDIANERIMSMETKLDSLNNQHESDKETWEMNIRNVEESWRFRCEALKAESEASSGLEVQREIEELRLRYKRLKEEHDSFRDLADRMIEEKDKEISRLIDNNKNLQISLESRPSADQTSNFESVQKQDAANLTTSAAEQQILLLARQQAQREEELAQSQRHILALQEEIEELERENQLRSQQEAMLKAELRNMERMQKREGLDMTYLKNVILKLLETGEVEALLPVIAMLLQFSPEEMQKCQQAYRASADVPPSPSSNGSGSIFSRFSFS